MGKMRGGKEGEHERRTDGIPPRELKKVRIEEGERGVIMSFTA